jgi:hypothetical protein
MLWLSFDLRGANEMENLSSDTGNPFSVSRTTVKDELAIDELIAEELEKARFASTLERFLRFASWGFSGDCALILTGFLDPPFDLPVSNNLGLCLGWLTFALVGVPRELLRSRFLDPARRRRRELLVKRSRSRRLAPAPASRTTV